MQRLFRASSFVVAFAIVGLILAGTYVFVARASVSMFFASSCLGGWENTEHAAGEPQVPEFELSLTSENAAFLPSDTQAEIYCGGFTGDIAEETVPKKITVKFSWDTVDVTPDEVEIPIDVVEIPEDEDPPTNSEIPEEESGDTGEEMDDETPEEAPMEDLPVENTPMDETPEEDGESEESPPVEDESVSFLEHLVGVAHAQEEVLLEEDEYITEVSGSAYGLVEVLYTLDGTEWESLGFVDAHEFGTKSFEIPIEHASAWEDISSIQIAVRSVPLFDSIRPEILLDAVWIEVSYDLPGLIEDATEQAAEVLGEVLELIELEDPEPIYEIDPASCILTYCPPPKEAVPTEFDYVLATSTEPRGRVYEREVIIDPNATQTCTVQPFKVDISEASGTTTAYVALSEHISVMGTSTVFFSPEKTLTQRIDIGSLPGGIDVVFESTSGYEYEVQASEILVPLSIRKSELARTGDFSISIVYRKIGEEHESASVCQLNIFNGAS